MKMKRVILNGPDFCAVTEDGRLTEYLRKDQEEQSGDILIGRIERMMPGMNCAFTDIGRKKNGFLPLEENGKTFQDGKPRSGDTVIVQIRKEETGEKGAFLTRDITLAGTYVIIMPKNRYIGVSSRIEEAETREKFRQTGIEIAGGKTGLVMRHTAPEAREEDIRQEAELLTARWQMIEEAAKWKQKPGTVLYHGDITEQLKDDYGPDGIDEILEVEALSAELRRQLSTASGRKVSLPQGGNIVIDRCEAMTVIDVNTASASGTDKERTVTQTNLEACREIAMQARLRNLGGIILIDFIDMESETDQSLVLEELKKNFAEDRIKTVIHGWTRLGLIEMTRKRGRGTARQEIGR